MADQAYRLRKLAELAGRSDSALADRRAGVERDIAADRQMRTSSSGSGGLELWRLPAARVG